MPSIARSDLAAAFAGAALLSALALTGVPLALGAHPWWAATVVWIGMPAGLVLSLAATWVGIRWPARATAGAVATLAGLAAAVQGKTVFAASFAENALAGRAWFFGWILAAAGAALLVAALVTPLLQRDGESDGDA